MSDYSDCKQFVSLCLDRTLNARAALDHLDLFADVDLENAITGAYHALEEAEAQLRRALDANENAEPS